MNRTKRLVACLLLGLLLAPAALAQNQDSADTGITLDPDVSGDVEFWHFWGSEVRRNAINKVIDECEAQLPNIHVTEVFKPFGDIWTANLAAVAGRSGMPDVIVADRPQLPRDGAEGVYQSLQPFIDRDELNTDVFWPFTWEQTLYGDESYGIPFETDVRVLFYNAGVLEEAGLEPPESWDDLWEIADELDEIDDDGTIRRMTFFPLEGNVGPDLWVATKGYDLVQDGYPQVDDPAMVETLEWVQEWIDRYGGWDNVQRFLEGFDAPPNDAFMSEALLMKVDVAGYTSTVRFYEPDFEWSATLPPYDETPASSSGGFALSIPTGAANADAAWEFIKCAADTKGQVAWSRDTFSIPTIQASAHDEGLMEDELWPFFVEAMEVSGAFPFVAGYPNWPGELSNNYEKVWTGEQSAADMLEEAQRAIDAQIEEAGGN